MWSLYDNAMVCKLLASNNDTEYGEKEKGGKVFMQLIGATWSSESECPHDCNNYH